ncbi:Sporulation domain protein [Thermocrinis albus DSM 14484]|uniref:Sporulation domain protein n=1 Tax=Thermocrinis albus (strain DSM 14484 / JCM 11386 / HI 11/12) TaxID=638303 RepID=D3SP49_THEAH|nr:SPOR domain-containing protein [Thermocrinis albus]ADC88936.1 Sporulation domain protein [Thermocrinis albus DSM 14484]
MKRERLILLVGLLVALVSFYVGLNQWLSSKNQPSTPVTIMPVKPTPSPPPATSAPSSTTTPPESSQQTQAATPTEKHVSPTPSTTTEAHEKPHEKPKEKPKPRPKKEYLIQVGAFTYQENAQKALEKAQKMGYKGHIKKEDGFYKVLLVVKTDNIDEHLQKLRKEFGGAFVK